MQNRQNLRYAAILALLVCSVLINLFQTKKIRQLRHNLSVLKAEGQLSVGARVPPIEGRDPDGNVVSLRYQDSEKPTILYVFSPKCVWCERNFQNVTALVSGSSGNYRYVGVSLAMDTLKDYLSTHDYGFPTYVGVSDDVMRAYKLGGTPQTIVVSREGEVLKTWSGAYTGSNKEEIESYFNTALPGITEPGQQISSRR